jgi:thiol-disulfide isomerase/thioredoxin
MTQLHFCTTKCFVIYVILLFCNVSSPIMKRSLLLLLLSAYTFTSFSQTITPVKAEQLVKTYQAAKGPTIINFWSTWCKPCIEEIPHFIALKDSLKKDGVSLMLVSLDTKQVYSSGTLKQFLAKKGWKANQYWLNETDADHYCPQVDKSWSGVIPVTLIINPAKNYSHFYEEPLNKAALATAIKQAL